MARRRLNENSNLLFEVNELRKQAHRLSETVANQVEQLKEKEVMILRLGGGRGGAAAHAHAHGGSYSQQLLAPLPLALTTSHSQAGEGGGAGLGAMTESSWGGAGGGSEEEKAPVTDTISRTGTPGNLNPPPSSTPAPAISGPPKSSSGAALRKSAVGVGLDGRKWVGQPLPSSGMLRSASTPLILHVMDSLASSTSAAAAASAAGGEGQRVSKDAGAGAEDGASVNSQVHSLQGGPVPTTSLRQGSRPPSPSPSPSAPAATAPAAAGGGGEQGKKAQPPPRLNVVMPAGGKASHERVVERLKAEALLLAEQLDIVSRERDHVRVENSQLRKQVRKFAAGQGSLVSSAGGGASQSHFEDSVGYSASSPVHGQHHGYDDNFDLESDAAAGACAVLFPLSFLCLLISSLPLSHSPPPSPPHQSRLFGCVGQGGQALGQAANHRRQDGKAFGIRPKRPRPRPCPCLGAPRLLCLLFQGRAWWQGQAGRFGLERAQGRPAPPAR